MTDATLLRFFRKQGMALPWREAEELVAEGYLEWVTPKFGISLYTLTDKGKKAQEAYHHLKSLQVAHAK